MERPKFLVRGHTLIAKHDQSEARGASFAHQLANQLSYGSVLTSALFLLSPKIGVVITTENSGTSELRNQIWMGTLPSVCIMCLVARLPPEPEANKRGVRAAAPGSAFRDWPAPRPRRCYVRPFRERRHVSAACRCHRQRARAIAFREAPNARPARATAVAAAATATATEEWPACRAPAHAHARHDMCVRSATGAASLGALEPWRCSSTALCLCLCL